MSFDLETLYRLLPAVHRARDSERGRTTLSEVFQNELALLETELESLGGADTPRARSVRNRIDVLTRGPLKALLAVIAEQIGVIEEDLEQLYDDASIETAAEWTIPYIGRLVGARDVYEIEKSGFSQRAFVANTVRYRRRKGTISVLERLARDVTGWDSVAVEFFKRIAVTQHFRHIRPECPGFNSVRTMHADFLRSTALDDRTRTGEVRSISSGKGLYNIPNIGIFMWRLGCYCATGVRPYRVGSRQYCFDPLGRILALFNRPVTRASDEDRVLQENLTQPFSRRYLADHLSDHITTETGGTVRSISVVARFSGGQSMPAVSVGNLADLPGGSGWDNMPQSDITIDPELGRLAFPKNLPDPVSVAVGYHYGAADDLGGGEYDRSSTLSSSSSARLVRVPGDAPTIQDALDAIRSTGGIVEVRSSGTFSETPVLRCNASGSTGMSLVLRAAAGTRPILRLSGDMRIFAGEADQVTINGLIITGGNVCVPALTPTGIANALNRLSLVHSTITPGYIQTGSALPASATRSELIVQPSGVSVELDHSICGPIAMGSGSSLAVSDSIIDAGDATGRAIGTADGSGGGDLSLINATVIGTVAARIMEKVSNALVFASGNAIGTDTGPMYAERIQEGCVRYSYIPKGSRVPRRYRCAPSSNADLSVAPVFETRRFGDPEYCRLHALCPKEISNGADDEGEMGVYHDLLQPKRETNLRERLEEYLRCGLDAGIFYST
jgi:hypothetical protein